MAHRNHISMTNREACSRCGHAPASLKQISPATTASKAGINKFQSRSTFPGGTSSSQIASGDLSSFAHDFSHILGMSDADAISELREIELKHAHIANVARLMRKETLRTIKERQQ
jgi:hypothetical protein